MTDKDIIENLSDKIEALREQLDSEILRSRYHFEEVVRLKDVVKRFKENEDSLMNQLNDAREFKFKYEQLLKAIDDGRV